ncbi:MAG: hypothetical protein K8T20_00835, partial [Planctomycetes bacterium]|nr:hypothetical protein [Planctomycetota bacterium]
AVAPGQADPGMEPLAAGRLPLWDERVMLIALRGVAQRDIDKGKKNVQDGDACATLDKEKALHLYDSSEDFFQHASDIVPDFGRQYLVEAVRKQIPMLIGLANDNVTKANASNPLDHDYGLQRGPTGKITFTGDGLGRYQSDKRDWNAYAGKIEECYKQINKLNERFPAEFAQHKKACDQLQVYYQKKLPEVRAFLDEVEKKLK